MTDLYSNSIIRNIYKRPSSNSEVSSQIIYGEKFKIIENKKNWIKIKTTNDKYTGYIKKEKIKKKLKIIFKTYKLKTRIFSKDRGNTFLSFNSRLPVINKNKNFIEFERGKWIKKDGHEYMVIFHPSYLLRFSKKDVNNPYSLTLNDLINVRKKLYDL